MNNDSSNQQLNHAAWWRMCSAETPVFTRTKRRHIPYDDIILTCLILFKLKHTWSKMLNTRNTLVHKVPRLSLYLGWGKCSAVPLKGISKAVFKNSLETLWAQSVIPCEEQRKEYFFRPQNETPPNIWALLRSEMYDIPGRDISSVALDRLGAEIS
jgi:hypothetical protein